MKSIEKSFDHVYDQALRWLARRAYGQAELVARLERAQIPSALIQQVVARCLELNYLNDERFALDLIRFRLQHSGWGPEKIRAELADRGLDDTLVERTLTAVLQEVNLEHLATKALRQHLGPNANSADSALTIPNSKDRRRCQEFLYRRGFSQETIIHLLGDDSMFES